MTSNVIRALNEAIENGRDYFQVASAPAVDYVRQVIRPALNSAVQETKPRLLRRHAVDVTEIVNVVHYTSLHALFAMVHDESHPSEELNGRSDRRTTDHRFLRLCDSANLNDPSEGAYFLKRFTNAYDVIKTPAYIASFVSPDRPTEDSVGLRDNLAFWRLYGNNGRGCSISVPAARFSPDVSQLQLRAVTYGSEEAETDAAELRPIVEPLSTILRNSGSQRELGREVAATILEALGELPYLYKSNAYKYERECRIVALASHLQDYGGIHYAFEGGPVGAGRLRMYGQHPCLNLSNILATGSAITLGPAVPNPENVQYALRQLLESVGVSDLPIECSGIPYRQPI